MEKMKITFGNNNQFKHFADVKKVISMTNSDDFQIVFKTITQVEDNKEKVIFDTREVIHTAIIQTDDDIIRHCLCYIADYNMHVWIDINNFDGEWGVINFKRYLTQMNYLKTEPLEYIDFIALQFDGNGLCFPPNYIEIDCEPDNFQKLLENRKPITINKTDAFGNVITN